MAVVGYTVPNITFVEYSLLNADVRAKSWYFY